MKTDDVSEELRDSTPEEGFSPAPEKRKWDVRFIVGMILFVAVFGFITANFWSVVQRQAAIDLEAERQERENAIQAIYLEYGDYLKLPIFVDLDTEQLFEADIPKAGIYNRNGVLIRGDVLEYGDKVRIYGDGVMEETSPVRYPGIQKMERMERATLEEAQVYQEIVDAWVEKTSQMEETE